MWHFLTHYIVYSVKMKQNKMVCLSVMIRTGLNLFIHSEFTGTRVLSTCQVLVTRIMIPTRGDVVFPQTVKACMGQAETSVYCYRCLTCVSSYSPRPQSMHAFHHHKKDWGKQKKALPG